MLEGNAADSSRKTVLVTGGSGVIGTAIVHALRESGHQVCSTWHSSEERATVLSESTGCEVRRADISDEAEVLALFDSLPSLWAVVHAAAISRNALLLKQSREDWAATMKVDAGGSFLITRESLKRLPDGGRLVLLASRVGEIGNVGQGAYAAAKAATIALAKVAAREGGFRHIAVNALCPGLVPSPLTASLNIASLRAFKARSVLGELGDARDVAGAVCWLLSDDAAGVSGQVIHCDSRI